MTILNRRLRGQPFKLDARALTMGSASSVLAVDARIIGSTITLAAEPPSASAPTQSDEIAVVSVDGPLAQRGEVHLCGYVDGYDWIAERFEKALESSASGVLLAFNSPGGDLAGLEQNLERMKRARDKSGKPVAAYVDEHAASAAYWLAAAIADAGIVLPSAGRVGSVGVIGALVDETAALAQDGIGVTLVREPEGKAAGHPFGPVHSTALARIQRDVRAAAERFYAAIAAERGLSVEQVRKLDGDVLEGAEAVDAGLADEVGTIDRARERARLGPLPTARPQRPEQALTAQELERCAERGLDPKIFAAKKALVEQRRRRDPVVRREGGSR